MKILKPIIRIFAILALLGTFSCSEENGMNENMDQNMIISFKLKVNNTFYHAHIDREQRQILCTDIVNPNYINDVVYYLAENTSVSPDPKTFMGNWKKEQEITLTDKDGKTESYKIIFPDLKDELADVLFIDEFNEDGHPNPEYWSLCKKGTSEWCNEMSESYDQAYCKDGKLYLIAEKIGNEYKAGGIESTQKVNFTFGKIEVKARLSKLPDGAFPAIWLMPDKSGELYKKYPSCGEIDIMEHVRLEDGIYHTVHTHYTLDLGITDPINHGYIKNNFMDWNIYGLEWDENQLKFTINGEETFTYPNLHLADEAEKKQWPFTKDCAMYFILNMGLGGSPDAWAGAIDDANLPAIMEIDWVKVSKL